MLEGVVLPANKVPRPPPIPRPSTTESLVTTTAAEGIAPVAATPQPKPSWWKTYVPNRVLDIRKRSPAQGDNKGPDLGVFM